MKSFNRRQFIQYGSIAAGTSLLANYGETHALAAAHGYETIETVTQDTIKVGILYSATGNAATIEKPLLDATSLAIEHINTGQGAWHNRGKGLAGRTIEPVISDPASNLAQYNHIARQLLAREDIVWLLGLDILTNEQISNLITSMYEDAGNRAFFIGADYSYAKAANAIGQTKLKELGGTVVGDEYVNLGNSNLSGVVKRIKRTQPDFIVSGLIGEGLLSLEQILNQANIDIPVVPFVNYPVTAQPGNRTFSKHFKEKIGKQTTISNHVEGAYFQIMATATGMMQALSTGEELAHLSHRLIAS